MKNIYNRSLLLLILLLSFTSAIAIPANPPPPTPPPPPGNPIDGGIMILFAISLLFGLYKIYTFKLNKKATL